MIKDTVGVNLGSHKRELLKNRLRKRVSALGLKSFGEYYKYLQEQDLDGSEIANMSSAITTNVTSFFREADHFKFLKTQFLPALTAVRAKAGNKKIRCWSAGCSTGQEPYTIAITISEFLGANHGWDIKILATDVSRRVLEIAERGIYKLEHVEKLDASIVKAAFKRGTGRWEGFALVKKHLRDMVDVQYLNLMEGEMPPRNSFDFIFCRNVLIYFDKATQQAVLDKYHKCLAPDGLLFLGHSEGLAGGHKGFKYVAPAVYSKA